LLFDDSEDEKMEPRTTILDGEDTQPHQVNDGDDKDKTAPSAQGEGAGQRANDDLMQDEQDTDGAV
jgi:hypothetical protein